MARIRNAGIRGTLTAPLSDSATSITETAFEDLPAVSGGNVLTLIVDTQRVAGTQEILYVTAHTAASDTVTVTRGQETATGHSVARAHAAGISWAYGPTPADFAVDSVDGRTGAVTLTDLYDTSGAADGAVAAHVADTDPHGDRAYADGIVSALTAGDVGAVATTAVGAANGVATLDPGGKVPVAQLPNSIMEYQGTWNASTNTPTLADGTGSPGDVYRVTVAGIRNLGSGIVSWDVGDYVVANASVVWEKSDTTDSVPSVFGRTGNVTAADADYSAAQVSFTDSGLTVITGVTRVQAALGLVDTALAARITTTAADAAYATKLLVANNQTGTSYTLVLGDAGKVIEANNASAIALTVPQNSSVAFPIGTVIEVYQQGAGQVTIGGSGITFRAPHGQKSFGQYSVVALWKRDTDTWVVSGDTTT